MNVYGYPPLIETRTSSLRQSHGKHTDKFPPGPPSPLRLILPPPLPLNLPRLFREPPSRPQIRHPLPAPTYRPRLRHKSQRAIDGTISSTTGGQTKAGLALSPWERRIRLKCRKGWRRWSRCFMLRERMCMLIRRGTRRRWRMCLVRLSWLGNIMRGLGWGRDLWISLFDR